MVHGSRAGRALWEQDTACAMHSDPISPPVAGAGELTGLRSMGYREGTFVSLSRPLAALTNRPHRDRADAEDSERHEPQSDAEGIQGEAGERWEVPGGSQVSERGGGDLCCCLPTPWPACPLKQGSSCTQSRATRELWGSKLGLRCIHIH